MMTIARKGAGRADPHVNAIAKAARMRNKMRAAAKTMACSLFDVVHFEDVFERAALSPTVGPVVKAVLPKTLMADIRDAPFLFIHVPKNGGHSVQSQLYRFKHPHASIRYYRLFFADWVSTKRSLAVIRDPIARFLSSYDFAINRGGSEVAVHPRATRRMGAVGTIDAFLDFLERNKDQWHHVDASARPQCWYVTDRLRRIAVTDLCLLEGENPALLGFLGQFGISSLPHANKTSRRSQTLTPEQTVRVQHLYAVDLAIYQMVAARGGHVADCLGQRVDMLDSPAQRPFR